MNTNIEQVSKNKLISILEELVEVISELRIKKDKYLLQQNYNEAREWLLFLKEHSDKESLKSLKKEVVERFYHKFDVRVTYLDYWDQNTIFPKAFYEYKELDNRRLSLMEEFLLILGECL